MAEAAVLEEITLAQLEESVSAFYGREGAKSYPGWVDEEHLRFVCPKCGRTGTLRGHHISAAGVVSPSVLHAKSRGCGWHVQPLTLKGWRRGAYTPA